jgi:hypothetical protein
MDEFMPKRTITYIDGFNLYHGLREKMWGKYLWLDLKKFSQAIIPEGNVLIKTKYFTSRIKAFLDDPEKPIRQSKYIDAISTLSSDVMIQWGIYQVYPSHCRYCNNDVYCLNCEKPYIKPNEKKTDVNIATAMLVDAFKNRCDTQVLISGDADYENTLIEIRRLFPKKELIVAFPPKRKNNKLLGNNKCTDWFVIGEDAFKNSQFPDVIEYTTKKGIQVVIKKPETWVNGADEYLTI